MSGESQLLRQQVVDKMILEGGAERVERDAERAERDAEQAAMDAKLESERA